jgi:Amt family ammonium transporter
MEMSVDQLVQYGWTLTCAALVLFMQAGFCCLEAGMVRHKNSINVALKNVADMCCSFAAFFVLGYGLMFGATQSGMIGTPLLFLHDADPDTILAFLFQVTFCATAATIVSGGVAERCRFLPYVIAAVVIGLGIYPTFGHWVWGGGWLSDMGYHDFAGSSVVHMVGAGIALAGIQILGPRAGRFGEDGKPRDIPSSNMPLVAVGVVILTFGWIGFNGGSGPLSASTPLIVTNTLLAACFGGLVVMLVSWAYGGLASADLVLNGVLGGLVAITAGADCVTLTASCLIGGAGGLAVVLCTPLLLKLKLDDAVRCRSMAPPAWLAFFWLASLLPPRRSPPGAQQAARR